MAAGDDRSARTEYVARQDDALVRHLANDLEELRGTTCGSAGSTLAHKAELNGSGVKELAELHGSGVKELTYEASGRQLMVADVQVERAQCRRC